MRQKDTNVNNNARMREFADIAHFAKVTDRRGDDRWQPRRQVGAECHAGRIGTQLQIGD